ncbi:hypothetical protein QIS99_07605 [Streptomyces sp. B-S-A8]|uniref:Uncharacterized protein n=1 Tax=Streptomyces solicavernae TaxID=3043614 RepID=A0ABT6RNS6_9ACTN|nr:hypothetical protein [Streptomyces sp. B-S-A8]MDI3386084.1 hypothetical protein [Streptomyces sp. B-S-A8]
MCADHMPAPAPAIGTLVRDVRRDRLGEFRGECCGRWFLRPERGGREWEAAPEDVQLADPAQRLRAGTARANARSRGEVL